MTKHFCCCIPVRLGVFVFSLLTFLTSGFSAFVSWFVVWGINTNNLSKFEDKIQDSDKQAFEDFVHHNKTGFIVAGSIFTLMCLMSFFGFIGSIVRNRRMVKAYSYMTVIIFTVGCVAAGFALYLIWRSKPFCIDIDNTQRCTQFHFHIGQKIGYTAYTIIELLIELYVVAIIRRYYDQLKEDQYSYDPVRDQQWNTQRAPDGYAYPYQEPKNAFGSA